MSDTTPVDADAAAPSAAPLIRVLVWNEGRHEQRDPAVRAVYPDGIHETIAVGLRALLGDAVRVRTATLDDPEHGLSASVFAETDVLLWWGHIAHEAVSDEAVSRVCARVAEGMGLIVLHSGAQSKLFRRLMGTTGNLRWRHDERETVWTIAPGHPITEGVPEVFVLPEHEMYGEFFDIPPPDELIFLSTYTGGEVFRSGCCWRRGRGRVFYFSPGHETNPIYHRAEVRRVLANAVRWAAPTPGQPPATVRESPHAPRGWYENDPESSQENRK